LYGQANMSLAAIEAEYPMGCDCDCPVGSFDYPGYFYGQHHYTLAETYTSQEELLTDHPDYVCGSNGAGNSTLSNAGWTNDWLFCQKDLSAYEHHYAFYPMFEGTCQGCNTSGGGGDPPGGDCSVELASLEVLCAGAENLEYFDDLETCEGWCKDCPTLAAECQSSCDDLVQSYTCDGTIGEVMGEQHTVALALSPCLCGGSTCNDLADQCAAECGGVQNVDQFNCTDGAITQPCLCGTDEPTNYAPEDFADSQPEEPDPDSEAPPVDPVDPEDTQENIAHNLYEITNNTHTNSENSQAIADNTKKIGLILDNELNETNNTLKNISSKLDALADNTEGLGDGNYSPDAMGEAYTTETFDFGSRTNTFFDELKNTSLFSLPSHILSDIPDSSNSTMSFDGGVYGQHTYDFASMGSIYVTLRAILITLFGYLSVRIVVLKR